jgi:hypothetical protein
LEPCASEGTGATPFFKYRTEEYRTPNIERGRWA